jgi:membrane fusion protein (multidrug efflux system)
MKPKTIKISSFVLALILIPLGIVYWIYASAYESTDDAFLETQVVAVSPRVAGHVQALHFIDNQIVEKDRLLVELDPRDFQASLDRAKADAAVAETEAAKSQGDYNRALPLARRDEISKQQLAHLEAEWNAGEARVKSAQAREKQAELDLSYAKIAAPWAGKITKKGVEVGAYIQAGQPLFSLVSQSPWVIANFKETQIGFMRPGQPVQIHIDALGKTLKGKVDSLQAGSGARFSLFPPENATGNFVKVVQRVPVKILLEEPLPPEAELGPGLSVVCKVKVK